MLTNRDHKNTLQVLSAVRISQTRSSKKQVADLFGRGRGSRTQDSIRLVPLNVSKRVRMIPRRKSSTKKERKKERKIKNKEREREREREKNRDWGGWRNQCSSI